MEAPARKLWDNNLEYECDDIPENHYDVTVKLSEYINQKSLPKVFDNAYFLIHFFEKVSTHIIFKHSVLIERMNDIIAKHYPGMLAAR